MGNSGSVRKENPPSREATPKHCGGSVRSKIYHFAHSSSKKVAKIPFKRKSVNRDHTRVFRELISTWPNAHIEALYRELEASRILSVLAERADSARPIYSTIRQQLYTSDTKDARIIYKGEEVLVHYCLLRVRCDILPVCTSSVVDVSDLLSSSDVSPQILHDFVHYLYTDEWSGDGKMLSFLRHQFECHRCLEEDLVRMEERAASHGDVEILLASTHQLEAPRPTGVSDMRVLVDSCVVSARSALLRRLLAKISDAGTARRQLVLDETLVPRAFLPIIVHFIYTDKLDLSSASSGCTCASSLSEVRAIVSGRSPNAPLHISAHLIHIARFFSLDRLVQLCEDVLHSQLSLSSCLSLLTWSSDGSSPWISRMATSFATREFSLLIRSPHLFDLPRDILVKCLQSHFLQASEADILEAVVRWGEHELLRRMEQREPNIIADTVHSVSRRGLGQTELGGVELKELVAPAAALIRVDYVLPPFHQSLTNAYQRGLLERAPLKDIVVCPSTSDEIDPDIPWFAPEDDAPGPRCFRPYYEVVCDAVKARRGRLSDDEAKKGSAAVEWNLDENVHIVNQMSSFVSEEEFVQVKMCIEEAIREDVARYNLNEVLTRTFHRRLAVQLIASRILRERGLFEDAVGVHLTVSGVVIPGPNAVPSDLPTLWPDLLTPSTAHSSPLI